ncbi:DUF389 domain-containing protein [Pleurocapsales cyanobacterium LEGE 10410]|nr:DUF389 domain-containing protein [Pleurocapsales cyanobacterium LEGE 10410]
MRQLTIQVPSGKGKSVLDTAKKYGGVNLLMFEATSDRGRVDAVTVYLDNAKVENFLSELESIPDVHINLIPRGVMALEPPPEEAPQQLTDVTERSPLEIFLAGLQSIGSWQGFISFAVAGGIVVWTGLFTNSAFLLVAAMLIAPFAGPAMNVAIATARGDLTLLWRSLLRYFAALGVTIGVTFLLSLIFDQQVATSTMVSNSQVSSVAVLLPLAAGAAGALQLVQSERSSLVSGAAVGILVAASLAPPAGIVGMATALGRWSMVLSGVFLLLLQLAGINLAATLVFRYFGLSARGARYSRGKKWVFPVTLGVTVLLLTGLLGWQFSSSPSLQRSSRAQRAVAVIQSTVDDSNLAQLVEANVRFTRTTIKEQNTLLGVIYVQSASESGLSPEQIGDRLTEQIQTNILQQDFNVTPLVDVVVLQS